MKSDSQILELAKHTFHVEAATLRNIAEYLGDGFVKTVRAIDQNSGRLIVTGIGKSALVAQKIVATLNSTGTQAVFMHAADAIHGDLGMITRADMVVCLSKSGETPEIKVLVPLVKQLGNALISIVSNPDSYLAHHSDFVLHCPVTQEADPNNLAPTASTTAQMAMGDALAVCLLAMKDFGIKDFATFHPGGSLGKQLYLRVDDLVDRNIRPAVKRDANIREVILNMTKHRMGATAVLDEQENLLGIITDGDLRRMLEKHKNVSNYVANDIMSENPKTINTDALAINAFDQMRSNSITQLIVMEDGAYIGMIHLHDLIREGFV